jgi:threonine dehydrogenase-like Zn-dependent dehydrogenase
MKTKAVRIHGKMDLRLDEIDMPKVGPGDVQVKVISDSICMSTYKAAVEGEDLRNTCLRMRNKSL